MGADLQLLAGTVVTGNVIVRQQPARFGRKGASTIMFGKPRGME
ncbi:MAG: hypothetical protein ACLUKN_17155 [Bacilli bacterium]